MVDAGKIPVVAPVCVFVCVCVLDRGGHAQGMVCKAGVGQDARIQRDDRIRAGTHSAFPSHGAWLVTVLLLGACDSRASDPASSDEIVLPDPEGLADGSDSSDVSSPTASPEPDYVTLPLPSAHSTSCIPDFEPVQFWTTSDRQVEFRWGDLRGVTAERVRGGEYCGGVPVAAYVTGPVVDTLVGELPELELRIPGEWDELGLDVSGSTAEGSVLFADYRAESGVDVDTRGTALNPLHPDTRMLAVTEAWSTTDWESVRVIAFTTPDGRVWASPYAAEACYPLGMDVPIVSTGNTMEGKTHEITLSWEETVERLRRVWREDHAPREHPLEPWHFNEATGWWHGDIYCGSYRCCDPEPGGGGGAPNEPIACSAHADCGVPDEVCARLPGRAATCVDVAVLGPCESDDDCEASQRETCTQVPGGASVCAPDGLLVDG